jgi:hypothetical protein
MGGPPPGGPPPGNPPPGGPPPGNPPPGGPPPGNPPPGGPPPGNPPPGGPPPGTPPYGGPPYIYRLGAGIPPCGLIHPNGTCVVLSVLPTLGGSGWSGPMALNRVASSSFTWPVTGLIVAVSVLLIGSSMWRDSASVFAISWSLLPG